MIRKIFIRSLIGVLLLCWIAIQTDGQAQTGQKKNPSIANYVSLTGETLSKRNPLGTDGTIHQFNSPVLNRKLLS